MIKSKIMDIIKENRPDLDELEDAAFIEDGLLDSFDIVTLVADFDSAFGISIDGTDIIPENFLNVEAIVAMLKKNGVGN